VSRLKHAKGIDQSKTSQLFTFDHIEPHNATCLNTIGSQKGKGLKSN